MKLVKIRILALTLATVFCIGAGIFESQQTASAATSAYNEPIIRIGMYVDTSVLDTRLFSSLNKSANGFEIGFSSGYNFQKSFEIANNAFIIAPQVNLNFANGSVKPDNNGNIGAYSAVLGKYSGYSAALSAAKAKGGFVAVVNGGYEARAYSATTAEAVKSASGGKTVASPVNGGLVVLDESGKIIFTWENTTKRLALRGKNGIVNFPMLHHSGNINHYDYRGFLEYSVNGSKLYMINVLGLEEYTKCVMSNEIGLNYSAETRKAFSVLARTVAMRSRHTRRGLDFDVCNNESCCQVYHGIYRLTEENNKIVDATRGLICTYEGSPISAPYHNSNGGASCSSVAAWGGSEVPYLTTVFLEEYRDGDKWKKEFTKQEFFKHLTSRSYFKSLTDDNINMQILETDPYGSDYITLLSVSDGSGNTVRIETSENVRRACGFSSANFTLDYTADVGVLTSEGAVEEKAVSGVMTADGYKPFEGFDESYESTSGEVVAPEKVTVDGAGVGHGVGFSATGSEKLAKDGYNYQYILSFFFSGTKLEYATSASSTPTPGQKPSEDIEIKGE